MTDLTEQWKKGELPEGFYYVKVKEEIANYPILADCVRRYEYYDEYTYFPEYEESITSVLAPVPSYDEWQEYQELDEDNKRNAQLAILFSLKADIFKELLKECRNILKEQNFYRNTPVETDTTYRTRCLRKQELLTKIDEVLNA